MAQTTHTASGIGLLSHPKLPTPPRSRCTVLESVNQMLPQSDRRNCLGKAPQYGGNPPMIIGTPKAINAPIMETRIGKVLRSRSNSLDRDHPLKIPSVRMITAA
jgi:hypothetical protein